MTREVRIDPYTGTVVHIVADRQHRPNLPTSGCPFCVGGREAPEPYDVRAFPNRWPALPDGYCEVVLYSPNHSDALASLSANNVRLLVNLWADRTRALRELPRGECIVIFENNGADIGATISHPHGQIYAFDHVPHRVAQQLQAPWTPEENVADRLVWEHNGWRVWTEYAAIYPISLRIAPTEQIPDLVALSDTHRDSLSVVLPKVFGALQQLFPTPPPYMMWWNQSPRDTTTWPHAWLNMEIVSPWRAEGVQRYIAGVEVATGEYFNPVDPADIAARLRAVLSA